MSELKVIENKFPILFKILGEDYIIELKSEEFSLIERTTQNPLFKIIYKDNGFDLEGLIRKALENNAICEKILKRFKDEKDNTNIQNFINEFHILEPMYSYGEFLLEDNKKSTPDFCAKFNGKDVAFECVSINENNEFSKKKQLDKQEINKNSRSFFEKNTSKNIHSTNHKITTHPHVPKQLI